jgi:hypothetical protein
VLLWEPDRMIALNLGTQVQARRLRSKIAEDHIQALREWSSDATR